MQTQQSWSWSPKSLLWKSSSTHNTLPLSVPVCRYGWHHPKIQFHQVGDSSVSIFTLENPKKCLCNSPAAGSSPMQGNHLQFCPTKHNKLALGHLLEGSFPCLFCFLMPTRSQEKQGHKPHLTGSCDHFQLLCHAAAHQQREQDQSPGSFAFP